MVVVYHAMSFWYEGTWKNGASGVDIFFVISGFVMVISSKVTASEFMRRRILRIAPLYWLVTFLLLSKMLLVKFDPALGSPVAHVQLPAGYVISSLLFIPYRNSLGTVQPILPAGWTLSFEMFFYLLFAIGLALKVNVVRFLIATLLVLAIVGLFRTNTWPSVTVLIAPILLEFLAGVLLAKMVQSEIYLKPAISAVLGMIGLAGLFLLHLPNFPGSRPLVWGTSAFLVVMAVVMLEDTLHIPKWVLRIGDASYSLYLIHALVLLAVARIVIDANVTHPNKLALTVGALVASVLLSLLLYRFVEKPIINASKKRLISQKVVYDTA